MKIKRILIILLAFIVVFPIYFFVNGGKTVFSTQYCILQIEMQEVVSPDLSANSSDTESSKTRFYLMTIKLQDTSFFDEIFKKTYCKGSISNKINFIKINTDKGTDASTQMKGICCYNKIPYKMLGIEILNYGNTSCFPIDSFSKLPDLINRLPENIDKCDYAYFAKEYHYRVLLSYTGTEVPQKITLKNDSKIINYTINNTPIQLKFKGVVAKGSSFNIDY